MSEKGAAAPVGAGLAVGIALIVLFASIFGTIDRSFSDNRSKIDIAIQGLKDIYTTGERIPLTIHISGFSTICDSSPRIQIVNSDSGDVIVNYHNFNIIICFGEPQNVDTTLTTEGPDDELGDIIINESGNYKLVVGQYGKTVEKEFSVIATDDDSAIDSIGDLTFNETMDLGIGD